MSTGVIPKSEIIKGEKPKLINMLDSFRTSISTSVELAHQIYNKVENIGFYNEPVNESEAKELNKPNNFLEELALELERLQKNNERLELIRDRLNELI